MTWAFHGFSKVCLLVWMRTCQCRPFSCLWCVVNFILGGVGNFITSKDGFVNLDCTWGNVSEQYGCWTKNRGKIYPPNHPFVHRVWNHYFHHPFWWFSPYFWKHPYGLNTPDSHLKGVNRPYALKKPWKARQRWFHPLSTKYATKHRKQEQGTMSRKHQEKIKHKYRDRTSSKMWWFHILFVENDAKMIQFDWHVSIRMKPPTSLRCSLYW